MALIQASIMSQSLFRTVPIQVILPVDKVDPSGKRSAPKKYKTLYLLHGLLGSSIDWVMGTRILRWAQERDLAVVMPSGENSFYVDRKGMFFQYGEFIGEELVELTRRMFPLSDKREDTFIGGLSMGGFGALRTGLKYHETFGRIIGFSSAVHILETFEGLNGKNMAYEESLFGDLKEAAKTDKNPRVCIENLAKLKKENPKLELPKIYLSCGTEDGLLPFTRLYRDLLKAGGFEVTYEEAPGGHEWDFWDSQIFKVLNWLPLEAGSSGLNSGNVDGK